MNKEKRPVVFISGKITGEPDYHRKFDLVEYELLKRNYIPLNPSCLPCGMRNSQYTLICMAMIGSADAVLFLPDWSDSQGARLEHMYCMYTGKPAAYSYDDLDKKLRGTQNNEEVQNH